MTSATLAKAERLLNEHRVSDPTAGYVFHVDGDTASYVVTIATDDVRACTCRADVECSHIRACVTWLRENAERAA